MTESKIILVIEDNEDVRENISEILILAGYEVYGAANGKIGVEYAVSKKPHLILCDIMMPQLDGYGVLKILSKNINTMHIPFIFLSAKSEMMDLRKGMVLGATDYITKPFDDADLLETIEIRLNKSILKNNTSTISLPLNPIDYLHKTIENSKLEPEVRTYNTGALVYQQGQLPRWFFIIRSGLVKTVIQHENQKELITSLYRAGDPLGWTNTTFSTKYAETTIVVDDAEIAMFPSEEFKKLSISDNLLLYCLGLYLTGKSALTDVQLLNMAYSSVRKKTANMLLYLHALNPSPIKLSREEMAALTGIAKETLIRTFSDFKNEGLIKSEGNSISITEPEKLSNLLY